MSHKIQNNKSPKNIVMVPPESGWSYVVCAGFTIVFAACMGHAHSFGMLFNDFFKERNESTSYLTTVHAVNGLMVSISGLLVNIALKRYTLRQLSIFGSILFTACWFLNIFITNVNQMMFTNGLLNGIGWGFIMPTGYNIFNSYFVRKKVLMMSVSMSIIGMINTVFPFFIEHWLKVYGYRGTMSLIAAISANTIAGSMFYQPVDWHLVQRELSTAENPLIEMKGDYNLKDVHNSTSADEVKILLKPANNSNDASISSKNKSKENHIIQNKPKRGCWKFIVDSLDLTLLKSIAYCNVCFGSIIAVFIDLQFYVLQPLLLLEYGFTNAEVASCVSITSISDLIFRISLTVLSRIFDFKSRHLFYVGIILSTTGRIIFLQFRDFLGVAVTTAALGAVRGLLYVPIPLMYTDIFPLERFAAAYGLTVLISGAVYSSCTPLLGVIRDATGTYVMSFYFMSLSGIIVIIAWTIEWCFVKNKKVDSMKT